jgi:hypothetical protein
MTMATLSIDRRFCGPAGSGNGGYTAGRLAALIGDPAEITLRRPPPLETEMKIERAGPRLLLMHGDDLIGPGGWSISATDPAATYVLGRMAGQRIRPPDAAPVISLAWLISRAARRATAGIALFTADGELCAYSKQTSIRLDVGGT